MLPVYTLWYNTGSITRTPAAKRAAADGYHGWGITSGSAVVGAKCERSFSRFRFIVPKRLKTKSASPFLYFQITNLKSRLLPPVLQTRVCSCSAATTPFYPAIIVVRADPEIIDNLRAAETG